MNCVSLIIFSSLLFTCVLSDCVTRKVEALSAKECAEDCRCHEKPCSMMLTWQIEKLGTGRRSELDSSLCTCKTCPTSSRIEGSEDGDGTNGNRPGRNRCTLRTTKGINEAECKQGCYCSAQECKGRWRWSAKNPADYRTFVCECELCNDEPSDLLATTFNNNNNHAQQ